MITLTTPKSIKPAFIDAWTKTFGHPPSELETYVMTEAEFGTFIARRAIMISSRAFGKETETGNGIMELDVRFVNEVPKPNDLIKATDPRCPTNYMYVRKV